MLDFFESYGRIWGDEVEAAAYTSVMEEVTDGRIRHGGGYRRWAAAAARRDGRGRSAARRAACRCPADAEPGDRGRGGGLPCGARRWVDEAGRRRVVRHGHAPKRSIQTGIGPIEVRRPRVRDRGASSTSSGIRFTSAVLPAYLRRARNVAELLPSRLYLKGVWNRAVAEKRKRSRSCSVRTRRACRRPPSGAW